MLRTKIQQNADFALQDLSAKLSTASDGQLPGILAALARFARYDRVNFDAVSESVVKDVLEILHRHLKSSEVICSSLSVNAAQL